MTVLYFVLLLLAIVCFLVAAFQVHTPRINLIAVGLLLWALVPFIQVLQKL